MRQPDLFHVDVFADRPLTGNGLAVFLHTENWPTAFMQQLTREMRQFESIFLSKITASGAEARIFTVEEELPFAGHPLLGAAAVLHRLMSPHAASALWRIRLAHGDLSLKSWRESHGFLCEMTHGQAIFGDALPEDALGPMLHTLGLREGDRIRQIPARVISTGLPYLILPVHPEALARAAIRGKDMENLLTALGAKFVLVLDPAGREMRTWDNLGLVEDIATGSAAGPAAACLFAHRLADPSHPLVLAQGRFTGRPSHITVIRDPEGQLLVQGRVFPVSQGYLDLRP